MSQSSILPAGSVPVSLPALLVERTTANPGKIILRRKARGIWSAVTWAQLAENTRQIGEALIALDIGRGDTVAVISETRPEAVYADLAILGTGAASVAIHADAEAATIERILRATGARVVFVEDEERLDKILSVRGACPALSRIVIFDMKGLREFHDPQCISFSSFADRNAHGGDWALAAREVTADQPAIVLFPRGDAAEPVVLTHQQVMQTLGVARQRLALTPRDNRLAVLSMADSAERIWGLYAALDSGCISNYLESPDTAFENLQELQPTVFGADAEAWAHLHGTATRTAKSATRVQRLAYDWAIRAGRHGGSGGSLADLLVLRWVRREFGLSRVRLAYIGGDPVSPPALDWAKSLGIIIHRIEEPMHDSHQTDPKYDPVMQRAHA